MLEIIGGECAGALALFPQGHEIHELESADEILNDQQLAELLTELRGNPLLGGRADIRLFLAGAQDKLAIKVMSLSRQSLHVPAKRQAITKVSSRNVGFR